MAASDEMAAFVRVVEKGSFAEAAKDMALTPSAISKTISRLEERIGTRLLTRTTRRLALTDEGRTYLQRCRDILAAIEAADAEASLSGTRPRGLIRISAGTVVGRLQLAHLLPAFHAAYPDITVDLRISEHLVDIVAENIDIALRAGNQPDSSLVARKLVDAHRVICASPAYLAAHGTPTRPADLLNHNCIATTNVRHLSFWPFRTVEGPTRIHVSGDTLTDNADVLLDLALAGQGIIRMLDIGVARAVQRGDLVPLLTDAHADDPVPIWALMPPSRNRLPRVRAFVDFLAERFADLPSQIADQMRHHA